MAPFASAWRTAAAVVAFCVAGVLAPAAHAGEPETQPLVLRSEAIDRPQLGVTASADAGQAVIEKGKQNTYEGLELSSEITWGDGVIFRKFKIQPGKLKAAQRDKKYIYYFPDRMSEDTWPKPVTPFTDGGVCAEIANPSKLRLFVVLGHCINTLKPPPIVRPIEVVDIDPASAYRALIYSGRAGDWVTFVYRQTFGDPTRPPLSQEVRFDLTKGPTVEFKGARFEILDVTGERVTYRLISSFAEGGG
jgi:hypothetical protein